MVKLSDEQIDGFDDARSEYSTIMALSDFLNQLTTEQLKHLCADNGLSVVEWVEFDEKNHETHPEFDKEVLVINEAEMTYSARWINYGFQGKWSKYMSSYPIITHWAYLPQTPKDNE